LILSPSGAVNFYRAGGAQNELLKLIRPYSEKAEEFSEDYYTVLNYYSLANYPANNFTLRKALHYEHVSDADLLPLLKAGVESRTALSAMEAECVKNALGNAAQVKEIIDSNLTAEEKAQLLADCITISNPKRLQTDLEKAAISNEQADAIEHQEEEDAELEEIDPKGMCAIELMTIVGSKGLSADHVIIIGFDNVNMNWVTKNAFFVAMTRARKSLHLITALRAGGAARSHDFLDQLPDQHLEFGRYTKTVRAVESFDGRNAFIRYLRTLGDMGRRR
jgi:superfamily I DNA/RNA helicase